MTDWKNLLRRDRLDWLLEASDPPVRYWTQVWILGLEPGDPELEKSRAAVADSGAVRRLVETQKAPGYWGSNPIPHMGSRIGAQLLLWLGCGTGMPGPEGGRALEAAARATRRVADAYLDEDCAYSYTAPSSGRISLLPCHGAELAREMFAFGLEKDRRFPGLVDWLLSLQGQDGAFPCPSKAGSPPCVFATALFLRLAEGMGADPRRLPGGKKRLASISAAAAAGARLLLDGGFARAARNRPTERWFTFGRPLLWDSDVLELLRLVAPYAGPEDKSVAPVLDLVLSKQRKDGSWACEKEPKSHTWIRRYIELEPLGAASKWVTLEAYRSLKAIAESYTIS